MALTTEEKDFVQKHLQDDVAELALKIKQMPQLNAVKVLNQIAGYKVIRQKVPSWSSNLNLLYPPKLALEQCSSEQTALYKAALVARMQDVDSMADLTGGLGVDFSFMSKKCSKAIYVERQESLCDLAIHNLKALGHDSVHVIQMDGSEWVHQYPNTLDLIYLDPARRDNKGSKVAALSDCEPDLTLLRPVLLKKARNVLVKVSPMLDISLALKLLPETMEVHVVSVDGECKELLFWLSSEVEATEPTIHAVNLHANSDDEVLVFTKSEETKGTTRYAKEPLRYLYEPNASILKAGAYGLLTHHFEIEKLHSNSHLYTSTRLIPHFPGRVFAIESVFPVHPKNIKSALSGLTKANITTRNFPQSVEVLRKKTGLKEGGDVYLFATTLFDERKVFLKCSKEYRWV